MSSNHSNDEDPDVISEDEDYYDSIIVDDNKKVSVETNYSILHKEDIIAICENEIANLSTLLSVPIADATNLLVRNGWDTNRIQEDWFSGLANLSLENTPSATRDVIDSYVDSRKKVKWCPSPDCDEFLVEFVPDGVGKNCSVVCKCGHGFCFNCGTEQHWPLGCEEHVEWTKKNEAEGENTGWILDNCKPCPQCRRPIHKESGGMIVICAEPCRFVFCWICLRRSDDVHSCEENTEENYMCYMRRIMARMYRDRYVQFYERWALNRAEMQKAMTKKGATDTRHKFILDAWEQVAEGRRIVQLSYAHGYFIPFKEWMKARSYESLQGDVLADLEELQKCIEKDSDYFVLVSNPNQGELNEFQAKVSGLVLVVRTRIESLLEAITSTQGFGALKMKNRSTEVDCVYNDPLFHLHDVLEYWECYFCTYENYGNTQVCSRCLLDRLDLC